MSGITVLSPAGVNRVAAQLIAPRLASLVGVTLGILNNGKPNSLPLQERVAALLGQQHRFGGVVTKQKPSAAVGAENEPAHSQTEPAAATHQACGGGVWRNRRDPLSGSSVFGLATPAGDKPPPYRGNWVDHL